MAHRLMLPALSAIILIGCQAEETFEGQETVPGSIEVEAEYVDLDVLSVWTDLDAYAKGEFIDAQAIVSNSGQYAASFTVTLLMINELGADSGAVEGTYEMDTVYTIDPGAEVEVFEGIETPEDATGTCSWDVKVTVVDDHREDRNRDNNKASSNVFTVGD